jgi:hypothetical protein
VRIDHLSDRYYAQRFEAARTSSTSAAACVFLARGVSRAAAGWQNIQSQIPAWTQPAQRVESAVFRP